MQRDTENTSRNYIGQFFNKGFGVNPCGAAAIGGGLGTMVSGFIGIGFLVFHAVDDTTFPIILALAATLTTGSAVTSGVATHLYVKNEEEHTLNEHTALPV